MIPELDNRGLLAAGVHSGTWSEIEAVFGVDTRRMKLLSSAKSFACSKLDALYPAPLFLAGSTFSDKRHPSDIEATLKVSPKNLTHSQLVLMIDLQSSHFEIKEQTEVDFYVTLDVPGKNDFSEFFQYVGEKTAIAKNLQPKDKRGVVEVDSWLIP